MRIRTLLLAAAATAAFAGTAVADTVVALIGNSTLVIIDTETRQVTSTRSLPVSLRGIDVRPADGMLYGVTTDGRIVTINTETGVVTTRSMLSATVATGVRAVVDFNPAADRLRVIGSNGVSHRVNVDDGEVTVDGSLAFATGDSNAGAIPNVIAGAYTNSVVGQTTESTQLFNITATGQLVLQDPPNDGTLNTIGTVGTTLGGSFGFDIGVLSDGSNVGWLLIGNMLYSMNLSTGEVAPAGAIEGLTGTVTDIAIVRD